MKPSPSPSPSPSLRLYQQYEMEDPVTANSGSAVGMELDDADHLVDLLGDLDRPPLDADFFNSFEDDFDDSDVA